MKTRISNPFVTGGYISPDFFCDRQEETKRIRDAISSGRNLTLISLRRMGKTGLLKHIKYNLEYSNKSLTGIYVDLLPTMNANEMLNSLFSSLYRTRKNEKNFLEKMLGLLKTLRPKLTMDPLTGEPAIELRVESASEIQSGMEQIMKLIAEIKKEIVIMLDEFQQITRYPEKNIEAMIRSVIQEYPTVPFIFSGSSKHMLENMFMSAGRPFYQSSELMYLDKINDAEYRAFIREKFNKGGLEIDDTSISNIFSWTRLHTYYVQYVCNHLYEKYENRIGEDQVNAVFHQIITDFGPQYVNYRNLLPSHQFLLLKAIAAEDGVFQPTSGSFIMKHGLTSASSVSTSLKALEDKEMIIYDKGKWNVYDVFFSRWLEYHYKE